MNRILMTDAKRIKLSFKTGQALLVIQKWQ